MCLVEIEGFHRPMPSCHLPVEPGMRITQASDSLFKLRRQNLEYILSDHNAYCMPPCQISCPTHIDIPGYLELMSKGQHVEAARLVKEVLPFPYMLGLVCPKPCQEVCRRGLVEDHGPAIARAIGGLIDHRSAILCRRLQRLTQLA